MWKKIYISESKHGKGVFARRNIARLEHILTFTGQLFSFDQIKDSHLGCYSIQIGKNKYLGPSGKPEDFMNHSCDPNSGLRDPITLVSIKNINANEEIVFDYSTSMDEDYWAMKCDCGRRNCRGIIRDFKYLPFELKEQYIRLGIIPKWVLDLELEGKIV